VTGCTLSSLLLSTWLYTIARSKSIVFLPFFGASTYDYCPRTGCLRSYEKSLETISRVTKKSCPKTRFVLGHSYRTFNWTIETRFYAHNELDYTAIWERLKRLYPFKFNNPKYLISMVFRYLIRFVNYIVGWCASIK